MWMISRGRSTGHGVTEWHYDSKHDTERAALDRVRSIMADESSLIRITRQQKLVAATTDKVRPMFAAVA